MEYELPVPRPPAKEFENAEAIRTIEDHPQLFKITTPIKVDMLKSHPNPEFVSSVMTALKEGFWPWADTHHVADFPITWDNARMSPRSGMEQQFIAKYRDEEIAAGRFSEGFGPELLPGMYSTPIHAVLKPHSEDFRMVSNMSAGPHVPNRMILHSDIAGSRLDGLHTFFSAILRFRHRSPDNLKQVVTTGYLTGEQKAASEVETLVRTVNRNNNFGGRGSGRVWYSINGLVTWVAINVEGIEDLGCYIDDDFSFDEWGKLEYYEPYDVFYPSKQTKLLKLWDRLGVLHSKPKQLFGLQLVIIGFNVDPNTMTATMPEESKAELVLATSRRQTGGICKNTSRLQEGDEVIFFFEALCVCATIHWVADTLSPELRKRVTILTDNTNTVDIFNSLRASLTYNPILKSAVDVMVSHGSRQKAREPWTLEKLYHERCLALGSAIDTATLGPYNSALNSYITFCKIHNFPVKPTADTMSYYVVFMSVHIKPESVSSYLSGICNRLENFFPDIREIRNSPIVSRTLKGCKRLKGSKVKRKSPLSHDNIRHAIKTLGQSSDYDDCLFLALLVTGFNGLLRLAELSMPDSKKSRNWRKVVHRTSVKWLAEGYTFFLPAHKADTAFEGNKVIIPTDDDPTFNPLPVFRRYLARCDA
ncbi:uncharacterized protein ARMOST_15537 [Armillaria ostoyae]|uniref:Uncharacterized protein n=1 Tax=Armillaria ostoyae TaxID=47428 RepID=A0A284RTP2_ARMOS|nr:uncharacterized protein ARMOST_15537 [Armillaria ostoyae]